MPSDYQKQIKEIFGTSDLDELRELAKTLKINDPNPRNAGRKAQLTPDQIVEVLELHRKGIGNTEIAKQFGVSRQTIYKYIYNAEHFSKDPDFTMRMNFMNGQQLCTVIDIDFKHEVVRMKNYTDRIPLRAFGAERGKAAAPRQPRGKIGRFWSRWPEGKGGVSYRRR